MKSDFKENINIALSAVISQRLRALLTIFIIAFGITAIIGFPSGIDALKHSLADSLSQMGANTFTIRNRGINIRLSSKGKRPKRYRSITFKEAAQFKKDFKYPSVVAVSTLATRGATAKFKKRKSNPDISVFGVDENYVITNGYKLESGRNFSMDEIRFSGNVALLGSDLAIKLFGAKTKPVGKTISVGNGKYKVIGVLEPKGSSLSFGGDKNIFIPLTNVRQYFSRPNTSYLISVLSPDVEVLNICIGEATSLFRKVRKLNIKENDNFDIVRSDAIATMLTEQLDKATMAGLIIGIITLLGAAVALMNSMLVSVTERTREIGIRKAIGATKSTIRTQFLIEAIVVCFLGGIVGMILGIPLGALVSIFMKSSFVIPWYWIGAGLSSCLLVGTFAGIYPAYKASKLDPIEALRYE